MAAPPVSLPAPPEFQLEKPSRFEKRAQTARFHRHRRRAEAPYTVTFATATTNGTAEADDLQTPLSVTDSSGNVITANADGSYTVPAGETTLYVSVPTTDDAIYEGDETFELTGKTEFMSTTTSGTGTIKDDGSLDSDNDGTADDDRPQMQIDNVEVEEGQAARFTVTVGEAEAPYTVTFATATTNGTAEADDLQTPLSVTDSSGNVITANADGSYTVPAGETTLYVSVPTTDDAIYEGDETFELI